VLTHPTLERLRTLQLRGMAAALEDQERTPDIDALTFHERLGLLLDREATIRADRRLKNRLSQARLRVSATIEDIDHASKRDLDKRLLAELANGTYIHETLNIAITGPTGIGKTYIACALANAACRQGHTALYQRLPRLLHDLEIAKGDGRYRALLTTLARTTLLIIDDWGAAPLTDANRRDLLELLDDRYNTRSTLITSQLPVTAWHEYIDDPTLADAILDRFIHNAHQLNLKGPSLRKTKTKLTNPHPPSQP
jgi:DNA replication protein DnaC